MARGVSCGTYNQNVLGSCPGFDISDLCFNFYGLKLLVLRKFFFNLIKLNNLQSDEVFLELRIRRSSAEIKNQFVIRNFLLGLRNNIFHSNNFLISS